MARRLRKISYDGRRVLVRWEAPRKGDVDEHELASGDKPLPALQEALHALREHVAEICDLPAAWCNDLQIRGVSCSYAGDEETLGVTITCLKALESASSPLVLNTPHIPVEPFGDSPCLSEACEIAILTLEKEAFRYVDGHREQTDLFVKDEPVSPPAKTPSRKPPKKGRKS